MSNRRHRERGAAALEMALVLPLLILLIGGIIDFGRLFMVTAALTNGAREGTRYAATAADPSVATSGTAIRTRAETAAKDMGGTLSASGTPTAVYTYTCASGVGEMKVVVSVSFSWMFLNALPGVTNPRTVTGNSVIGCT